MTSGQNNTIPYILILLLLIIGIDIYGKIWFYVATICVLLLETLLLFIVDYCVIIVKKTYAVLTHHMTYYTYSE